MYLRSSDSETDSDRNQKISGEEIRRGEYKPRLPPAAAMYSFLNEEDDDEEMNRDGEEVHSQTLNSITNSGNNSTTHQFLSPFSDNFCKHFFKF